MLPCRYPATRRGVVASKMRSPVKMAASALAVVVFGGLLLGFLGLRSLGVLPRLSFAPGWSLEDQLGRTVTSDGLRGRVVLLTFSCLRCEQSQEGTFKVLRETLAEVRRIEERTAPIVLATVSLDSEPSYDRQARTAELGAGDDEWLLLSGSRQRISEVVREGFEVYFEKDAEGNLRFDPVFLLVDGLGIVRARYRIGYPSPDRLARDIRSVLREVGAESSGLRLAYQAAHFFSCYSQT